MRYLFTFSLLLISSYFLSAQSIGGCGTEFPVGYNHTSSYAERMNYISQSSSRASIRWIGVIYHIITKDDGTGGCPIKDIFDTHCELNTAYSIFNIGFYITDIDTIKNTTLWEYQTSLGYSAFSQYNIAKVCNIYVNGNLPGLCGFATFPQGTSNRQGGIFLSKDCVGAGTKTLPHEMGHYLNLPHTFESGGGVEFVNGTNCSTAGDGFCDTPADFLDARTPCPYTGNQTDPNGDLYKTVIDETLFMSYFSDNCVNRFSNEEQAEMNSTLTSNRRSYLLNQPMPDTSPLDSAILINPLSGDTTVNSSVANFKWHSVPRAMYYFFRVQSSSSSVVIVDTLITDTAYTLRNLTPNKNYKFRVKAISYGNTCGDNASYQFIQTATIKTTLNVTTPSCPGEDDAAVSAIATNGSAPYAFTWSNGATGAVLSNVPSGIYTVTITDNHGEVAVANVQVGEPSPLSVDINKVGNNLNASGNGGTAPYTYAWSNAVAGPGNNNIGFGDYIVTVTDAKGCTSSQSFIFSALGVNIETKVSMKIFPNPASQVASLNLQVELNERTDAVISLINVNGQTIQQVKKEFMSGTNTVPMSIAQIPSGVYFVQFKSNEVTKTERVSVIR